MRLTWSLEALYESFDSIQFQNDLKLLENSILELSQYANHLSDYKSLEDYYLCLERVHIVYVKLFRYSSLTFNTNTNNTMALQMISKLQNLFSSTTAARAKLVIFLSNIDDLTAFISSSNTLKELEFVLSLEKRFSKHLLSEEEEILASKLSLTGSKAWNTLQQKLTSTLKCTLVEHDKEVQLPITVIRNMAYDPSPEVRKKAYEAEMTAYSKVDEAVAMALNSIKGEVLTMCDLRGYNSPLELTLETSRMTEKTLAAMLDAMKMSLPSFHKYLKTKAKLLGHENGLPFYDLFAPIGTATKLFTYDEGCHFIKEHFSKFSDKLASIAEDAIANAWIDVEPREGKVSGAFCASLHPLGEFRILLNYTGNLGDVTTMAHELGHGYHAICTNQENILNINYPMPLAETASTFCETIVNNAALNIATKEEAITILENSLQDATQVVCDIYSRFIFESNLFDARRDHPLSVAELNQMMLSAQRQAYGEGLSHETLHPYMWLIKPHYYSAELGFYNFPYAFGLLFAKGLYAIFLSQPEFFKEKYDTLLASSGKADIIDVCKIMNIDVESTDFWKSSLDIITQDIERFIEMAGGN